MAAYAGFKMTAYVSGKGSIRKLTEWKDRKIGLVIDENIIRALKLDELLYHDLLKDSTYEILCNMMKEPDMDSLKEAIDRTRSFAPDYIVAIGGGSVMDAAKTLQLFYELPHYTWETAFKPYQIDAFPGKCRLVAVPTTSGTGSETTGCAVIKDKEKRKCLILSNEIVPDLSILDFDLLRSLPGRNIAYSGADALAHALEAGASKLATSMVRMFCTQAAVTIIKQLPSSFKGDLEARETIHVAATMAGAGINNSITGMAHGMDQMGGDYFKPHGLITGMLLPYTIRYMPPQPIHIQTAEQLGFTGTDEEKKEQLVRKIWQVYEDIGIPKTLKQIDIDRDSYFKKIPSYIERAKNDANILMAPIDPTDTELETLYQQFYNGVNE